MQTKKKGVLYVGMESPYFDQAKNSAESVKSHNNVDISLITTNSIANSRDLTPFDNIIIDDNPIGDVRDKNTNLIRSPYEKTLYLDGDTLVLGDITPVFELLDRTNIALATSSRKELIRFENIPEIFPAMNTGVIAYNKCDTVEKLFKSWNKYHEDQINNPNIDDNIPIEQGDSLEEIKAFGSKTDQPPLRKALYESDIMFSILPDEYNYGAWGRPYAYGKVKIIHGNEYRRSELSKYINEELGERIYIGGLFGKLYFRTGESKPIYGLLNRTTNIIIRYLSLRTIFKYMGIYKYMVKAYRKLFDWG